MKIIYEQDEEGRRYCRPCHERIQEHLTEIAFTMPIDMTDADLLRERMSEENKTHISINSLVFKASTNAVEDFPIISGMWLGKDRIWVPDPDDICIGYGVQVDDSVVLGNFKGIER